MEWAITGNWGDVLVGFVVGLFARHIINQLHYHFGSSGEG